MRLRGKAHSAMALRCVSLQSVHISLETLVQPLSRRFDHLS